jgi:hypothetical protein
MSVDELIAVLQGMDEYDRKESTVVLEVHDGCAGDMAAIYLEIESIPFSEDTCNVILSTDVSRNAVEPIVSGAYQVHVIAKT